MAGWFPGHGPERRPEHAKAPTARRLILRVWPKRRVVVSLALVDVRRASDSAHV
jgi:hypothetical protein